MNPIYIRPIAVGVAITLVLAILSGMILPSEVRTSGIIGAVFVGVFTGYIMANLAGNQKLTRASQVDHDRALQFQPSPGKAQLMIVRQGFVAKAAGMNIILDGTPVGQIKAPQFLSIEIEPGRHVVHVGLGGLAAAQNNDNRHEFEIGAGGVVLLSVTVSMGAMKNSLQIQRIDPSPQMAQAFASMPMILPSA